MNKFVKRTGGHHATLEDFIFFQDVHLDSVNGIYQNIGNNIVKDINLRFVSSQWVWDSGIVNFKNIISGLIEPFLIDAGTLSGAGVNENNEIFFKLVVGILNGEYNNANEYNGKKVDPSPVVFKDTIAKIVHLERKLAAKIYDSGTGDIDIPDGNTTTPANGIKYSTLLKYVNSAFQPTVKRNKKRKTLEERLERMEQMLAPLLPIKDLSDNSTTTSDSNYGCFLFWGKSIRLIPPGWAPVTDADWKGRVPMILNSDWLDYSLSILKTDITSDLFDVNKSGYYAYTESFSHACYDFPFGGANDFTPLLNTVRNIPTSAVVASTITLLGSAYTLNEDFRTINRCFIEFFDNEGNIYKALVFRKTSSISTFKVLFDWETEIDNDITNAIIFGNALSSGKFNDPNDSTKYLLKFTIFKEKNVISNLSKYNLTGYPGQIGGRFTHVLTQKEMPSHNHNQFHAGYGGGDGDAVGYQKQLGNRGYTGSVAGGGSVYGNLLTLSANAVTGAFSVAVTGATLSQDIIGCLIEIWSLKGIDETNRFINAVPANTFITGVSGSTITLSNALLDDVAIGEEVNVYITDEHNNVQPFKIALWIKWVGDNL